jgi:anti-sigma B factor antagonist
MSDSRNLRLRLESTVDSVDAAEIIAQRFAVDHGFPAGRVANIGMAVREAMVNAVSHGNAYSKEKNVKFSLEARHRQLTVTIQDEGGGFELDEVPDPLASGNLLKTSGRGLLLMRAFVDSLEVRRGSPAGTEVKMILKAPEDTREQGHEEEEDVSLSTGIREVDGVTIIDLSGRITLGEASGKLRDTIREVLSKGQKKVLLNLGDVSYIDSSGLGELVSSYTTASNQGAKVKLLNVQKKVQDLLQITKLYTVFESYVSEADGVLSFS